MNTLILPYVGTYSSSQTLSYMALHPLVSNMYLITVSESVLQVSVCILLGDGVDSLTCKLKSYFQ